mgnify:CR=1 FL=1
MTLDFLPRIQLRRDKHGKGQNVSTAKMDKLISLLRVLVWFVLIAQAISLAAVFINDEDIYLQIEGELWHQPLSAFQASDQFFVAVVLIVPTLILMWGLFQIAVLCRYYKGGVLFALDTILCFKRFAIALIALAVVETLMLPILIFYLWSRQALPGLPDFDPVDLLEVLQTEILLVGVLFFVITRIMETGLEMKQEVELTI